MRQIAIILIFIWAPKVYAQTEFWQLVEKRWLAGSEINFSEYVEMGEEIRNPPGATIPLIEVKLKGRNFSTLRDCLVYQVPALGKSGTLQLISLPPKKSCQDMILIESRKLAQTNCYNLAFKFGGRNLKVLQDTKSYVLEFFNLKNNTSKKIFDTSASTTKVPGVEISFIDELGESLPDGEICFDVDDSCKETVKNKCDECKLGSFPIIASGCSTKVRRYCGVKNCGLSGGPACIRGFISTGYTGPYCINDSPVAYCTPPARVVCLNEELLCR